MIVRSRVLIVDTNPMIFDGIFSTIINYAENIDKSDMDIDFVSINEPDLVIKKRIKKNGSKLFVLKYRNHDPIKYIINLSRLIRKGNYTLVHVHGSSCIMAIELLASKLAGVPCCPHSHSTNCQHKVAHKFLKPLFHILYKNGFACGEEAGRWLYGKKSFEVVKNGIVCEKFRYSEKERNRIRAELNISTGTKVIISVAHFSSVKNHVFMIDMMEKLQKKDHDCCLLCVGEGELFRQTDELIKAKKLENNIKLLGVRQDVTSLLSAADLLILPSLYEGLPFTLIEAQASGLDCFVSEVVTRECCFSKNMYFYPLELKTWVEAIDKSSGINDRKEISSKNITEIRKAGYDISITASKLKKLYQKYEKRKKYG